MISISVIDFLYSPFKIVDAGRQSRQLQRELFRLDCGSELKNHPSYSEWMISRNYLISASAGR